MAGNGARPTIAHRNKSIRLMGVKSPDFLLGFFQNPFAPVFDILQQGVNHFVVIKDKKVIGVYDDQATAVSETQKTHELGTFLVQKVEPGTDAHTQTFHSRVVFAE